jgi:hypothetical protein
MITMDEDIQCGKTDMRVVVDTGSLEPGEDVINMGELNTKLPALSRGKVDGNTRMVFTLAEGVQ